jgi:adenylate cyclase
VIAVEGWCEESFAEVAELLRQAIQQSPGLAFAHAYLALLLALGHLVGLVTEETCEQEARGAAERALALDGRDSDVLGYAGCAFADLGDTLRGIGLLELAVELDPSNAQARVALGAALMKAGRREGVELMRQGMHISPRDNRLPVWGAVLARGLLTFARLDEAIDAARTACRHADRIFLPWVVLAIACAKAGQQEEAAAAMAEAKRIRPQLRLNEVRWAASPQEIEMLQNAQLL